METPPVLHTWSVTHLFYNNCSQICGSSNPSAVFVAQSLSSESQPHPQISSEPNTSAAVCCAGWGGGGLLGGVRH